MTATQKTISPVDGSLYVERPYATDGQIEGVLMRARAAQRDWRRSDPGQRASVCTRFVDALVAKTAEIAPELSWQMGRPVSAAPGEVGGFEERARYMIEIAGEALADLEVGERERFTRFIRREPLGVCYKFWAATHRTRPAPRWQFYDSSHL